MSIERAKAHLKKYQMDEKMIEQLETVSEYKEWISVCKEK